MGVIRFILLTKNSKPKTEKFNVASSLRANVGENSDPRETNHLIVIICMITLTDIV